METLSYQREVKASKEHRCNFCSEKIRQGEVYYSSTHKQDGEIYDWKTHLHCAKIANRLKMYADCDEGVGEGDFHDAINQAHNDLMIEKFPKEDIPKYREVIMQLRNVHFRDKLSYVIRHYACIDKIN